MEIFEIKEKQLNNFFGKGKDGMNLEDFPSFSFYRKFNWISTFVKLPGIIILMISKLIPSFV